MSFRGVFAKQTARFFARKWIFSLLKLLKKEFAYRLNEA